jgi:hypothetical protein
MFIANHSFKIIVMKNLSVFAALFLLAISFNSTAQPIKVPTSLDKWEIFGSGVTVENFQGKESFFIKQGAMLLKDVELLDGIIEADISVGPQRGFPGFAFRYQDTLNFENFYIRPHQSGNPDATQYTPVFNGSAGWQLYHGEGYSKAFAYKFNEWHHLKIDLHGLQADIYIDDMEKPLIKVTELKRDWKGGRIGIIGGGVPFRVANVQYTPKQGSAPVRPAVPINGTGGIITKWQVSNAVDMKMFNKQFQLTNDLKNKIRFTTQQSEPSGTINLANFTQAGDTNRTIIARFDLESASDQIIGMSFGFSDFVTVYVNDRAIFSGSDNFLSRDYRYLGTIGFFDRIYLPLKKGNNEVWFVVSENFGGWGVKAMIEEIDKIRLK